MPLIEAISCVPLNTIWLAVPAEGIFVSMYVIAEGFEQTWTSCWCSLVQSQTSDRVGGVKKAKLFVDCVASDAALLSRVENTGAGSVVVDGN